MARIKEEEEKKTHTVQPKTKPVHPKYTHTSFNVVSKSSSAVLTRIVFILDRLYPVHSEVCFLISVSVADLPPYLFSFTVLQWLSQYLHIMTKLTAAH